METLSLYSLYEELLFNLGPQGWWPAESKAEIIVGAILVQNTKWTNVEKSLHRLRERTFFEATKIASLSEQELIELIRPSGFYQNKSKAILAVFHWLEDYGFDFKQITSKYKEDLRQQLLSLPGIGEETADVLLLYVFDKKIFIADKYTRQLFSLLGIKKITNYHSLKKRVPKPAAFSLSEAQEFHGLLDEFGKLYVKDKIHFDASFLAGKELVL